MFVEALVAPAADEALAVDHANDGIKHAAQRSYPYRFLAWTLQSTGDTAAAVRALVTAVQVDPTDSIASRELDFFVTPAANSRLLI